MKYLKQQLPLIKLFLCLFILCTATSFAQGKGSLKGAITTSDNKPAEGVSVTVKELNRTTIADNNGFFTIKNVPVGNYTLTLTLVGYHDVEEKVSITSGETTDVNIHLTLSNNELNQVVILSNKSAFKTNRISSSLRLQSPIIEIPQNIQVVTGKLIQDQQIF